MFLDYTTARGKHYALRPEQVRALESEPEGTRIWASIAGIPVMFVDARPYDEVYAELKARIAEEQEMSI